MTIDGQTFIAILLVVLATLYLSRQAMLFFNNESRGCSQCPSRSQTHSRAKSLPLVQLHQPGSKERGPDSERRKKREPMMLPAIKEAICREPGGDLAP